MPGGFCGIPRVVWKHPDFFSLSGSAVKLLVDLCGQFRGKNNGDLTVAWNVLNKRGWKSKTTITRAVKELIDAGLIIQTRTGRFLNPGKACALYGLTWKAIDDCEGKLDIEPTIIPSRRFSFENNKKPSPHSGQDSVQNVDRQRLRDSKGRYISVHKVDRLRVVT